ncbi:MAG: hypothetical protein R3359_04580 [Marinirhabdus sp.]|nr:hypothetical protein [Marinirhabdus sp.]
MKNTILLAFIFAAFTSFTYQYSIKTYDLEWAISNNIIQYNLQGNDESPHYYQPLRLSVTNLTDSPIQIRVPNGQQFKSVDSTYQDIVVTKEELIAVGPRANKQTPIFGMCTEKFNPAPNTDVSYTTNGVAKDKLSLLAQEIQNQEAFSVAGQNAVWMLTDNGKLGDVTGYGVEDGVQLRTFMANMFDIPVDDVEKFVAPAAPVRTRTVGGNFRYRFPNTSSVTIGMFNAQDIIVKELYNNPETPPGEHRLSYEFDTLQYGDEVYYIRLIVDGQIKINFEMKPRGS